MRWPIVSLPTICKPKQWPTVPKSKLTLNGYPVFGANGKIGFYSEYTHKHPTVLITCRGATCGSINVSEPKSYVTGNAMALDDLDETKADLRFVVRVLNNTDFGSVITGVAQPQITRQSLSRLEIPLPPLQEQKRIASILDAADALKAKRRESIEQLDLLIQSTFLEMFGDPVTNPKGWTCRTVGDALEDGLLLEVKDGNHGEQHPKAADFSDDGVPFIMSNCMHDGELDLTKTYKLPEEWLGRLRTGFSRGGDALLSHKGTIGEVAIVPDDIEIVILSPQVTYYRTSESLLARYLVGMFGAEGFQRLLEKAAKQSTRPYIGITRQKKLPIIVPPLDLQTRFASIVESIEKQKTAQRAQLAELDNLFGSLQQNAFNGTLWN